MTIDYAKLKQESCDTSSKLQDLMSVLKLDNNYYDKVNPDNIYNHQYDENKLFSKTYYNEITSNNKLSKLSKNLINNSEKYDRLLVTNNHSNLSFTRNRNKSLISSILSTIPLAIPTLQLHLLLSLTMVLLTHQCPQYLIVL